MTGKNIGIWLITFLCITSCLFFTGCSNVGANKRTNPAGAETDPESSVSTGSSSTDNPTTRTAETSFLPVVNIYASQNIVGAGSDINLRAEAIDPAGAPVTLTWDASEGILVSVNGSSAVWQAPAYTSKSTVSCTATDVRGGKSTANIEIEVIGNSMYKLNILVDRCSLFAPASSNNPDNPFVPAAGARVILKEFNDVAVSDKNGNVEFNVTQADKIATYSDIIVSYKDWNITYNAKLTSISGNTVNDYLVFSPGYQNLSVALANGDSFDLKKGMLEITATEKNAIGISEPLPEVSVNCSAGQGISDRETGCAVISSSYTGPSTSLNITKTGYSNIENCNVPVNQNSLTLVSAEMTRNGNITDAEPSISWIKPYNYKTRVSVMEPFVIGFGQPMQTSSVFESINMMVQNKTTGELIPMTGNEIKEFFNIVWKGNTEVSLYPRNGYKASTRYSILINNWTAKSLDGRYLKSYLGTYYEFETDDDPAPKVLAFEPVNGATQVSRNGPFTIYFDRSIEPDSLYENTELEVVSVDSGLSVTLNGSSIRTFFSVIWKNENTELRLIPNRTLSPRTSYQIRIKKCSFKSSSGKAISGLENFWTQFTTGGM
ncbi:MAG: Ig-like domain-containing protein [Candidatus Riflebacteria bacterium]|nr:Ig-like domain-containing protein [Candidatus Riflebacteria bacterium]